MGRIATTLATPAMTRPLILLIAFSLFTTTAYAEDAKQSPAVKRILDKAVGKVRTNRTEFDKANKKPLDDARAELQDLSTKLIKEGKTEEAGIVLKQVGSLDADVMRMANAPAPNGGGGGRVPPQKPLMERLAGKWEWAGTNAVLIVEGGGGAVYAEKDGGKVYCQGRVKNVSPNRAETEWGCANWFIHVVDDDTLIAFEGGWNHTANGRFLKRLK